MINRQKVPELDALLGCRIRTQYDTGGVVIDYSGPYPDRWVAEQRVPGEWYTVRYRTEGDRSVCWLNSITVVEGVVLCEGKPLEIGALVEPVQTRMF